MKKKLIFLILIVSLIEILSISNFGISFECNLSYIEVDRNNYYPDETIKINASWTLDYNPINEEAYIQVRISDDFDTVVWNSSKYDEIGNFSKNWSVNINFLNLTLKNYTNYLYIKFVSGYHQIGTMDIISNLLETIQVKIRKRIPFCQLIGFKDQINYGDSLIFQARFFDDLVENNTFLNNQLISFLIESNNSTIFQSNFTTNYLGRIDIFISSIDHLNLGVNNLIFELEKNIVYNDSKFQYEVLLEKNPILIDVISFKEDLGNEEDLIMELFYYSFFNNTVTPLKNQEIELVILDNKNIVYSQVYTTDLLGILSVAVPYEFIHSNKNIKTLKLNLIFNGSLYLENRTLSLNLNINIQEVENVIQLNFVLFISILVIISLISLTTLFKFKNGEKKLLPDITIRY